MEVSVRSASESLIMSQRTQRLLARTTLLFALPLVLGTAACGGDDGAPPLVDDDGETDPGSTSVPTTATAGVTTDESADSSSGFVPLCTPDDTRCSESGAAIEVCAPTGLEWVVDVPCAEPSACEPCNDDDCTRPSCIGPCQLTENDPSSAGCAFVANRQSHIYEDFADGIVVTNPSEELTATVTVFEVPEGLLDEVMVADFPLAPGESEVLELETEFEAAFGSSIRTGGIFRIYSTTPVVAYQHAPLQGNRGNESALLLPDRVLGNDYVVMSYTSLSANNFTGVSYFELVALEDNTRVEWTPKVETQGNGLPIDPVPPGETGELVLNRYETIRIVPSRDDLDEKNYWDEYELLDISGTLVHTDKPVWVTGANRYSRVPSGVDGGTGDQLQETLFPLQHWGTEYVLPSGIARIPENPTKEQLDFIEPNYYRIYAGASDVTVTSTPADPAFPVTLDNVGDFVNIETAPGTHLSLEANAPFMPVQYLRSLDVGAELGDPRIGYGDPAMVQMVPTEQYLSRYVFATGINFYYNYLQITRAASDDEVSITDTDSGNILSVCPSGCDYAFEPAGDFEVAWLPIPEGTYLAEADTPFGIIQSGHGRSAGLDKNGDPIDMTCVNVPLNSGECNASYAYPGGMKAESIFIP